MGQDLVEVTLIQHLTVLRVFSFQLRLQGYLVRAAALLHRLHNSSGASWMKCWCLKTLSMETMCSPSDGTANRLHRFGIHVQTSKSCQQIHNINKSLYFHNF